MVFPVWRMRPAAALLALSVTSTAATAQPTGAPPAVVTEAPDARYLRLMGEAQALAQRSRWNEALARVTEAEHVFGPQDANTLVATVTRGQLLLQAGRLREAEQPLRDGIAGLSRFSDVPPQVRFMMTVPLAMLYQQETRWAEAEGLFTSMLNESERLRQASPDDPSLTEIMIVARSNLGFFYTSQGRYAEGEAVLRLAFEQNAAVPDPGRHRHFLITGQLANNLFMQRRYEEAEPLLLEVQGQPSPPGFLINPAMLYRNSIAQLYVGQRRYREAEPLLRRALSDSEALGVDNILTIGAVNNLADVLRREGRIADAEPLYQRALSASERVFGADHLVTANAAAGLTLNRLASPAQSPSAIVVARRFVAALRALRAADPSQTSATAQRLREQGQRAYGYTLLADAAWSAAQASRADRTALGGEAFGALQEAMAGPAGRAVAQMAVRRIAGQRGQALGALVREREELNARWSVNNAEEGAAFANSGPEIDTLKAELRADRRAIEGRMAAIDTILRDTFPDYFALVRAEPLDISSAQALLAPDEAILMVVPTEFGTHVVAVGRTGFEWHRSSWSREQVDQSVRAILQAAGGSLGGDPTAETGPRTFPRQTAYRLYREVVAPVASLLTGKRHIFIAAGGSLSSLPFGLMVTAPPAGSDSDPAALRETSWFAFAGHHALVQIPSVQSLAYLRRPGQVPTTPRGPGGGFIGFGNPALHGPTAQRGLSFSGPGADRSDLTASGLTRDGERRISLSTIGRMARLPGTAIELEYIRASLGAPSSSLFLAERATETNVKSTNLAAARILAFATHGLLANVVREAPEPGLVLTPPASESETDDGYLTASEVSALTLDADWVILSACNTAAGDGTEGAAGLTGLARAFFYAGARNLLASHWPVRDDVAAQITVRTIQLQRATAGLSRAEAFRDAMREVLLNRTHDRQGDSWAHPNAWAPFILIGDGAR